MIGNIFVTLALLASVFSIIMYYLTFKGYANTLKLARLGYHAMSISVIAASAMLLHAILTHQYQFKYVFNYSNSDLPLGLLMSTFYAGQEGSFMLWLLFTSIVGLILLEYTSKRGDLESRVMMIFTLAASFLLVMVSPGLKSPFAFIWSEPSFIEITKFNQSFLSLPFLQNFFFSDPSGGGQSFVKIDSELIGLLSANGISFENFLIKGKGLNPLLQNFWMQIHPPILFVGFAMATVPFAFAFSALIKNEYADWVKQSLPWVSATAMVLGVGIMLGGYWAYGVLGWGGFWGWDPVENASLIPWLIGAASVHTLLVQRKTQSAGDAGRFVKTNLILAILTYILVLYSTFLTRSGILGDASVHSFVAPGMLVYFFLVLFIGTFSLLGIGAILFRWKYLENTFKAADNVLSRELAIFTGAVALIASAVIVFAGTSAPIFGRSVELSFYNELNLPIAILMGLLNGLSLILKWTVNAKEDILKNSKLSLLVTIVVSALIIILGSIFDVMLAALLITSLYTLAVNLEIAIKVYSLGKIKMGGYVAHIGMALFFVGIVTTGGFTEEKQAQLIKNEPKEVLGFTLTFKEITPIDNGKKYQFDIEVKDGDNISHVSPVMFIAEFNNSLMREPDILSKLTKDIYVAPVSYQDAKDDQSTHNHGESAILKKGETKDFEGKKITFSKFNFPPEAMAVMQGGGEFFIGAILNVEYNGKNFTVEPKMVSKGGDKTFESAKIDEANLRIEMNNLDASGTVSLVFNSLDAPAAEEEMPAPKEILTVDASIKPFISLVWIGVLVMALGFAISIVRRTKESK